MGVTSTAVCKPGVLNQGTRSSETRTLDLTPWAVTAGSGPADFHHPLVHLLPFGKLEREGPALASTLLRNISWGVCKGPGLPAKGQPGGPGNVSASPANCFPGLGAVASQLSPTH